MQTRDQRPAPHAFAEDLRASENYVLDSTWRICVSAEASHCMLLYSRESCCTDFGSEMISYAERGVISWQQECLDLFGDQLALGMARLDCFGTFKSSNAASWTSPVDAKDAAAFMDSAVLPF